MNCRTIVSIFWFHSVNQNQAVPLPTGSQLKVRVPVRELQYFNSMITAKLLLGQTSSSTTAANKRTQVFAVMLIKHLDWPVHHGVSDRCSTSFHHLEVFLFNVRVQSHTQRKVPISGLASLIFHP